MAMPSASEIADKWAASMRNSEAAYKAGINRTDVNPMEEAAKNVDGYRTGVLNAIDSGKYVAGLRRVTKEDWQAKCINLGASRIAAGAAMGKAKQQAFMDKFLPHLQAGMSKLKSMPKATLQDRIARAVAMMEHNANFKR